MMHQFVAWASGVVEGFRSRVGYRGGTVLRLATALYPPAGDYPALPRKLQLAQRIVSQFAAPPA
jgi:hypothetical protein